MATPQLAIRFLLSHSSVNYAVETADGIIATAWLKCAEPAACADSDEWCETVECFPIVDGNVCDRAVRAWLGY